MPVYALFAADAVGGIGLGNALPWHLPDDLRRFKDLTRDGIVVMGRKTFESLPPSKRPLPDRDNWVITHQPSVHAVSYPTATFLTLEDAVHRIEELRDRSIFVIGGGEILESLMPVIRDGLYLTRVQGSYTCDTFLNLPAWLASFPRVIETIRGFDHVFEKRI
jgi:dihydrofolate reductase